MDFKVLFFRNGKNYPSKYSDGKPEIFIKRVKAMEEKYNVSLPKIEEVYIGDDEYPINEIHFKDGLRLYDEEGGLYDPVENENKKRIDNWVATKEDYPIKDNEN